jgi:hypothetical protein
MTTPRATAAPDILVHSITAAEPETNDVNDAPMRLSSPSTL